MTGPDSLKQIRDRVDRLLRWGRLRAAEHACERGLTAFPEDVPLRAVLTWLRASRGSLSYLQAIEEVEQLAHAHPDDAAPHRVSALLRWALAGARAPQAGLDRLLPWEARFADDDRVGATLGALFVARKEHAEAWRRFSPRVERLRHPYHRWLAHIAAVKVGDREGSRRLRLGPIERLAHGVMRGYLIVMLALLLSFLLVPNQPSLGLAVAWGAVWLVATGARWFTAPATITATPPIVGVVSPVLVWLEQRSVVGGGAADALWFATFYVGILGPASVYAVRRWLAGRWGVG